MSKVVRVGHGIPYDVYIGRACRNLPCSPYANPFVIGRHGDREDVIRMYKEWIYRQPRLIERVRKELPGKVLGCWCAPKPCHGDVLVEIASPCVTWEAAPHDDLSEILHAGVDVGPRPDKPNQN